MQTMIRTFKKSGTSYISPPSSSRREISLKEDHSSTSGSVDLEDCTWAHGPTMGAAIISVSLETCRPLQNGRQESAQGETFFSPIAVPSEGLLVWLAYRPILFDLIMFVFSVLIFYYLLTFMESSHKIPDFWILWENTKFWQSCLWRPLPVLVVDSMLPVNSMCSRVGHGLAKLTWIKVSYLTLLSMWTCHLLVTRVRRPLSEDACRERKGNHQMACDLRGSTVSHPNIWNVESLEELYPIARKMTDLLGRIFEMTNRNKSYNCPNSPSSHNYWPSSKSWYHQKVSIDQKLPRRGLCLNSAKNNKGVW